MSKYYEPPSDRAFNEIKDKAIELWSNPNYNYHWMYVSEKVDHIKPLENIKDNYAHIIAMFDNEKQVVLIGLLSNETRQELFPPGRDYKNKRDGVERLRPRSLW